MSEWTEFLRWESASRDAIDFKKIYVDMADDLIAGLLLSQIVYWYLQDHTGKSKLRVVKDSYYWIAKSRTEWWEEIRITAKQVDRALDILTRKGIVITGLYRFNNAPTIHVRINEKGFLAAWEQALSDFDQRVKSESSKGSLFSPNVEMDFDQRIKSDFDQRVKPLTETTTETTTEITEKPAATAAGPPVNSPPDYLDHIFQFQQTQQNRVNFAVPPEGGGDDSLADQLIKLFCRLQHIVEPDDHEHQTWQRAFDKVLQHKSLSNDGAHAAQGLKVLLDPDNDEFNYYTYANPCVKKFQDDYAFVLGRILAGGDGYDKAKQQRKGPRNEACKRDLAPGAAPRRVATAEEAAPIIAAIRARNSAP